MHLSSEHLAPRFKEALKAFPSEQISPVLVDRLAPQPHIPRRRRLGPQLKEMLLVPLQTWT